MKTPPPDLADRLLAVSDDVLAVDADLRLEDVARMVGASRATLYYYFAGRDDLLAFLLSAHVREGAAAMAAADDGQGPPADRLRAVVVAMAGYLGGRPGTCAALLAAAGARGALAPVLELNDARIAGPLRELLTEGRATGAFDVAAPADAANAILGAVLMAVLGRAAAGRDPADPDFTTALADQILRGVSAGG
ncbi:TetR/AcrR family transcriptional regulator [Euzebya sp.]|uniref:TetR/AcrR family transcriptional regulator n=1 Tax=Euzebya sp. TaxID=1971409 RepID=UPI0035172685